MKKGIVILVLLIILQTSFSIFSANNVIMTAQATRHMSNIDYTTVENYLSSVFSIDEDMITINKISTVSTAVYGGKEVISNIMLSNNILGEIRLNEALNCVSSISFSVSEDKLEDFGSLIAIPNNLTKRIFSLFSNDANYCNRDSHIFDILPEIRQNSETIINKVYFIYMQYKTDYSLLNAQLNNSLSKYDVKYSLSLNNEYLELSILLFNSTDYISKLKIWRDSGNDMIMFSIERNVTYANSWVRTETHYISGYLLNRTIIPIDFCGGPDIPWKISTLNPKITSGDAIRIAKEKCRYPQHIKEINYEAILYPGSGGNRDPYTLYPLWVIFIQYDGSYQLDPNSSIGTSGYILKIWADTGDILLDMEQCDFGFTYLAPILLMYFITSGIVIPPIVISVLYYRNVYIKKHNKK